MKSNPARPFVILACSLASLAACVSAQTAGSIGPNPGSGGAAGGGASGSAGAGDGGGTGTGGTGAGGAVSGTSDAGRDSGVGAGGTDAGGAGTDGVAGKGGAAGTAGGVGGAANGCPVQLMGWAAVNADGVNGTTGGGDVAPTTVTTFADLKAAAADSKPRVIILSGTIKTTDGGGFAMTVTSNKTIIGKDSKATIYGGIDMSGVSNVIIRNLNIQGTYPNSGPDDTVASHGSHHIWYDHLAIWDSTDGSLDITNASDYQTVSWTKFWYTDPNHPHRLASLNGSGGGDHPEDWGHEKVTYHHNWWADRVNERMPRVMYGLGHQFNNYFTATGNLYCIGVGSYGAILVENNYFKNVNSPHLFMYDVFMDVTARGNVYDNVTGNRDTGRGGVRAVVGQDFNVVPFTTPPYSYTMDAAADVPTIVQRCVGPR